MIKKPMMTVFAAVSAMILCSCGSASVEVPEPSREEAQLNKVYRDALLLACELDNASIDGLDLYRDPETRQDVIDFYIAKTGDAAIALPVLAYADDYEIPVSLAFAMAYAESSFRTNAINYNYNPFSIDRGLFQLNSRTFPELAEDDFFDPEISAYHGMKYLAWCLHHGENEVKALALYNAGIGKVRRNGAPESTLDYINKIMNYRKNLEREFALSLCSSMGRLSTSGKKSKIVEPLVDRKKSFE